jgi:hypothetical protein
MHRGGKTIRQTEFVLYHCEVHDFILEKEVLQNCKYFIMMSTTINARQKSRQQDFDHSVEVANAAALVVADIVETRQS